MPARLLYFGGPKDPTELSFELGLLANQERTLAVAVFDGEAFCMDMKQVIRLVCVGLEDQEWCCGKPPFVRLTFPFVHLQFYPHPGVEWIPAIGHIHGCVRKLLNAFPASLAGPRQVGMEAEPKEKKNRRTEEQKVMDFERANCIKRRRSKEGISEEEEERKGSEERREDDMKKDNSEAGSSVLLENARSTYERSLGGLIAFLPKLDQLNQENGLLQVKQVIQSIFHVIPSHYTHLFPPENNQETLRRQGTGASMLNELAELYSEYRGSGAEVHRLKGWLSRERNGLETEIVKTMGLLFPQGGRRTDRDDNTEQYVALLENLNQQVEEICEVEMLLDLLSQRI